MNRTNEIPSGDLTPEKPKPTQALLKQSNESIKMAVQNIVPVSEVPTLVNEVVTVTTSDAITAEAPIVVPVATDNGVSMNVSTTQEVKTIENDKKPEVSVSQTNIVLAPVVVTTTATTPTKIVQSSTQFVQVKPPTTTSGRVQSPNVKNFFIRKGIEKQPSTQTVATPTFITTTQGTVPQQINQLPANKKIIIKSQQILVPANNVKQSAGQIIQVSGQSNVAAPQGSVQTINSNVIESSTADLSGILDLPILFADNTNESTVIDQSQILSTTGTSNILVNTSVDRNAQIGSPTNIFISTTDGKLPSSTQSFGNRPVVISAAKVAKPAQQTIITTTSTPTSSKVIFINRNQIRPQGVAGTQIVKGLPTLKLVPTSLATTSQSTPITLQGNQLTKLSPGTKIDLSQLKLVKNASPGNVSGNIMKPLIINKAMSGAKNAIVIKSPITGNVQTHPAVIKANVLNRNITVKKVMNVMPGVKPIASSPIAVSSANSSPVQSSTTTSVTINTATVSNKSPVTATTQQLPKTTRKTRNSN